MVRTTENKLIIEMDAHTATEDLHALRKEIIGAIQLYNYEDYGNTEDCPFYQMLCLLEATLPTYHQTRHYLEFTRRASDPAPDKAEFEKWIRRQLDWIKKDNE